MDRVIEFLKKIHAMKIHILTVGGPKESALSFLAFMYKEKLDQLDKLKDKSKATVQEKHTISHANRQIPPKGPHKEDIMNIFSVVAAMSFVGLFLIVPSTQNDSISPKDISVKTVLHWDRYATFR